MVNLDSKAVLNWHIYGLKPEDLEYTFVLHKNICDGRIEPIRRAYHNHPLPHRDDIFDDIFYYANLENMYVWAACLWRLQGLFEGLIKSRYLGVLNDRLSYSRLLNDVEKRGFVFCNDEKEKLLKWARLRNALSHYPPEMWRPATIEEDDIRNYLALLQQILSRWERIRVA